MSDRVTVIFSTRFKEQDDVVLGKVFMQVRLSVFVWQIFAKSPTPLEDNPSSCSSTSLSPPSHLQLCHASTSKIGVAIAWKSDVFTS